MGEFTHFDNKGNAIMVDVSEKEDTLRVAVAKGRIAVSPEIMEAIKEDRVSKGDVLGVARVAGIMAVKQTSNLIPMCHPIFITKCSVDFEVDREKSCIYAICTAATKGATGVEMEALTGVTVALLTIYDMCKAMDKSMEIGEVHSVKKSGGKSGDFINEKGWQ